jgi:hypothetical protein
MIVFVLHSYTHQEGEETWTTMGVFTKFAAAEEKAAADEREKSRVMFNTPQYSVEAFLLDGHRDASYFRRANGVWAINRQRPNGTWHCEENVKPADVDAETVKRAYLSASGDMLVNHDRGIY